MTKRPVPCLSVESNGGRVIDAYLQTYRAVSALAGRHFGGTQQPRPYTNAGKPRRNGNRIEPGGGGTRTEQRQGVTGKLACPLRHDQGRTG